MKILFKGMDDTFMEQSGFYLSVNNNSQLPLTKFEGIKIPTGFATNIAVKKTFYHKLEEPYSDCRKDIDKSIPSDSPYFKATLNITKYSQKLCFEICLQNEHIIPTCKCADPSIPLMGWQKQQICTSSYDLSCVYNVTTIFNTIELGDTCDDHCPLECDSEVNI